MHRPGRLHTPCIPKKPATVRRRTCARRTHPRAPPLLPLGWHGHGHAGACTFLPPHLLMQAAGMWATAVGAGWPFRCNCNFDVTARSHPRACKRLGDDAMHPCQTHRGCPLTCAATHASPGQDRPPARPPAHAPLGPWSLAAAAAGPPHPAEVEARAARRTRSGPGEACVCGGCVWPVHQPRACARPCPAAPMHMGATPASLAAWVHRHRPAHACAPVHGAWHAAGCPSHLVEQLREPAVQQREDCVHALQQALQCGVGARRRRP